MDSQKLAAWMRGLAAPFNTGQIVTLVSTFVLVVALVVGSALWLSKPTYALLLADMDAETTAQVVARLKTLKVPYALDDGGRGVRVPAGRVDELRLELTAQGPPASGRIGFEIFDRTAFGATEFQEKVNFRRALEGEIARTVATLSEVAGARVHIAMGKESVFGEPRPTTASVILKLRSDRPLAASTVNGIANLVAAGIEGLRPESVVIVDTFGRPLARPRPDDGDAVGAAHLERQQRLERELTARVTAMLEPIVGADRVRVNVALTLNPETKEQTQEVFDPNAPALRSRQTSSDSSAAGVTAVPGAAPGVVPGTAGARANLPPPAPPPGQTQTQTQTQALQTGPTSSRTTETLNNEISRTTTRTVQPAGEISRLSVAVIIDDDHVAKTENGVTTVSRVPRDAEQLKKIEESVSAAVGLNVERGDRLTVQNIAFEESVVEDVAEPTVLERWQPQIEEGSRIGVLLLIVALAFFFFVRPVTRRLAAPPPVAVATSVAGPSLRVRTVAEMQNEIEAQLDAASALQAGENLRLPVLTKRVAESSRKGVGGLPLAQLPTDLLEEPATDRHDEPVVFDDRHEFGRRHETARRMTPAHQRLEARQAAGAHIDDGLKVGQELVPLERQSEVGVEVQALLHLLAHRGLEGLGATLAGDLGAMHRRVGVMQQFLRRGAPGSAHGNPDARRREDLAPRHVEGGRHHLVDPVGDAARLDDAWHARQQDDEVVAADPRQCVV